MCVGECVGVFMCVGVWVGMFMCVCVWVGMFMCMGGRVGMCVWEYPYQVTRPFHLLKQLQFVSGKGPGCKHRNLLITGHTLLRLSVHTGHDQTVRLSDLSTRPAGGQMSSALPIISPIN